MVRLYLFYKVLFTIFVFFPSALVHRRRRRLKEHPLEVSHEQEWGRGFIFLLPQTAVLPGSDAGSDGVEPPSGFVI